MKTITRQELAARIRDPELLLLEALPESAYKSGHLPGARWFSMDEGRALAHAAACNSNVPNVVYDENCELSRAVATVLENVGYRDVRVYAGGKADWQAAGLPVEI